MADQHATRTRTLIAAARDMTLATSDARGRPLGSPVWFAEAGPDELLRVPAELAAG